MVECNLTNTQMEAQLKLKKEGGGRSVDVTLYMSLIGSLRYLLHDGYYMAYKPITLLCILFMFIEMKFIHCHSCVMFAMKFMSMCND